jgi:release factor glutamine methyltransferase
VTLHEHVARARDQLRQAGIAPPEADLDARVLAGLALGWDQAHLVTAARDEPPDAFEKKYAALVGRRAGREPIAYIAGVQEFWGLPMHVSPAVLIPRPETELLVEAALERFPERAAPFAAADLCTGSGCVAVAIAHERPAASILATDVSTEALDVARENATLNAVGDRVSFVATDLLETLTQRFDLIVSNPPYVPDGDRPGLPPEVRDHEPPVALYAGSDGLATIDRLVQTAPVHLQPGGTLIFEFGFGQAEAVEALISRTPALTMVEVRRDLQGIPRAAIAKKNR